MSDLNSWIAVPEQLPKGDCLAFYKNENGKGIIVKACYFAKFEQEADYDDVLEIDYNEKTDSYFVKSGWYERVDNWPDYYSFLINDGEVTHWMPIPMPPEN